MKMNPQNMRDFNFEIMMKVYSKQINTCIFSKKYSEVILKLKKYVTYKLNFKTLNNIIFPCFNSEISLISTGSMYLIAHTKLNASMIPTPMKHEVSLPYPGEDIILSIDLNTEC